MRISVSQDCTALERPTLPLRGSHYIITQPLGKQGAKPWVPVKMFVANGKDIKKLDKKQESEHFNAHSKEVRTIVKSYPRSCRMNSRHRQMPF